MTTRVLFMCPHSAGKSLAAATYFRAAAARSGVDVTITVAGTDPDDVNMANVAGALTEQGFTIGWNPKRVDGNDTAEADIIVNIGCDVDAIPTTKQVTDWDVPMLSEDFAGSIQAIHRRSEALARQLSQA